VGVRITRALPRMEGNRLMNSDHLAALPGLLTETADLLAGMELAGLPPLCGVVFSFSHASGTWRVSGQLSGDIREEVDGIHAIRTWAAALGAEVHLSDRYEARSTGIAFRRLEAVKALDYGTSLHVWTHIDQGPVTAAAAPVALAA
jgi:hypothetical protein